MVEKKGAIGSEKLRKKGSMGSANRNIGGQRDLNFVSVNKEEGRQQDQEDEK